MRCRPGFTLVEVALAAVVIMVGSIGAYKVLGLLYEQLAPGGEFGGLRGYMVAEQLLQAQAEGLRVLQTISPVAASNKLVRERPAGGFLLEVLMPAEALVRHGAPGDAVAGVQLAYFDLVAKHRGRVVGVLSLSTLRSTVPGQPEKIGL